MGCEGGSRPEGDPGFRRIAAFRTVEGPQGGVRSETLLPYRRGLRVASASPVRLERSFSGGSALEPSPVGVSRFHEVPQIPIFEAPTPLGEQRI